MRPLPGSRAKGCAHPTGCSGAAILQAIDDALNDGVDVISISIGMSGTPREFLEDPMAIGAFHAEQKGVMVICSAGNDGPDPYTVLNTAPWLFTVAASSLDRDFWSNVLLGNGRFLKGTGINFSKLSRSATHPLVLAKDAAANSSVESEARVRRDEKWYKEANSDDPSNG